ncbi:AraC family transcriptional regulator [Vibrio sp. MA64]|uniref:AraC family transcriptional regulator n=1 Tax=Vibrio sp. MA64 TaxID=2896365 RepID=UPI001E4BBD15|nr:AraC family transcriptional regulator [Vibrio sp. MA64]MCC9651055.1 AraC family transcriptional regulator [Vibrio sp. MA64]
MSLKTLMQRYVDLKELHDFEGDYPTKIANVRFYRSEKGHLRKPTMYKSGLIILGQGNKALYAGGERIPYGAGDCLVMGVPMPVECEAYPNSDEPLLGMGIEIPIHILQKQVTKIKNHNESLPVEPSNSKLTIRRAPIDEQLRRACSRLMEALCDDLEAEVLGEVLLEEVIFFALLSKGGDTLFTLADQEGKYARISTILQHIHTNYAEPLNVSKLAVSAGMSISSFHTAFKDVTLETPVQYIKKVRLDKARELICFEGKRVNETAHLVGYSSAAQFSREFKRHFGEAPKDAAQMS